MQFGKVKSFQIASGTTIDRVKRLKQTILLRTGLCKSLGHKMHLFGSLGFPGTTNVLNALQLNVSHRKMQ